MAVIGADGRVIPNRDGRSDRGGIDIASIAESYREYYPDKFGRVLKLIKEGSWDDNYLNALHNDSMVREALDEAYKYKNTEAIKHMYKIIDVDSGLLLASKYSTVNVLKYYLNSENKIDPDIIALGFSFASERGDLNLIKFYMEKYRKFIKINDAMAYAARGGHRSIVEYFIRQGAKNWDKGLEFSSEGDKKDLIRFFVSKGSTNWNAGLIGAARGGSLSLIRAFEGKGADAWARAFNANASNDNASVPILEYLSSKGPVNYNTSLTAASFNNKEAVVRYLRDHGAHDLNRAMITAVKNWNITIVVYLIMKGANDWNGGLAAATYAGNNDLIKEFLRKGVTDYNEALIEAVKADRPDLVSIYTKRGATNFDQALTLAKKKGFDRIIELLAGNYEVI